jgi:hypothetical protein
VLKRRWNVFRTARRKGRKIAGFSGNALKVLEVLKNDTEADSAPFSGLLRTRRGVYFVPTKGCGQVIANVQFEA